MSLSYNYPPQMAYPSAPPVYRALPAPPRLHWGWVLALTIVTVGIFAVIWMAVQAYWVKKATKNGKAFGWALAYVVFLGVSVLIGMVIGVLSVLAKSGQDFTSEIALLHLIPRLGGFVLYLFTAYTLKAALEAEPIDIPLSGVVTFFLGAIYFQYHLYDYSVEGRVGEQLSGFGEPAAASVPVPVVSATEVPPQA
jgi:hypothetical protein